MTRLLLLPLSLLVLPGLSFAQPLYTASLATPQTTRSVVKEMRWTCAGAQCTAPRDATAPDIVVCEAVARKLGPVTAFSAGERAFSPAQIAQCNGSRR